MNKCSYTKDTEVKVPNPSSGRLIGKEFSKTLFQTMHELKNEIRGVRNEIQKYLLKMFAPKGSPTTSYDVCEHSTTQSVPQRCSMPTFLSKKGGRGGTPKEEYLGDYLQEYESQSERFKKESQFPKVLST